MKMRHLFRTVEKTVSSIGGYTDPHDLISAVAAMIFDNFKDELHISGCRIYQREENVFTLATTIGNGRKAPTGYRVPITYAPIEQVLDNGIVLMDQTSPGVDASIEKDLGVDQFAAIAIGGGAFILSFSFSGKVVKEWIYYTLNILRHAINNKLQQEAVHSLIEEARMIQEAILPKRHPSFHTFDIYGLSRPAERVGGDYFDYLQLSENILGIAVGDATGHGLPAALLIRDVYVGLRMGMLKGFKFTQTFEQLNAIINRGKVTSRFVSLFYGELEPNGNFIYANAGHNPPYRFDGEKWHPLDERGLVLGPIPEVTYRRGMVHLAQGELLVLYTDGIVEAANEEGEMLGEEKMREMIEIRSDLPAQRIVEEVLERVEAFVGNQKQQDDMTLVIVKNG